MKVNVEYVNRKVLSLDIGTYTRLKMLADLKGLKMANLISMLVSEMADRNNVPQVVVTNAPKVGRPRTI